MSKKVGDTLKIADEHKEAIEALFSTAKADEEALNHFATKLSASRRLAWDLVRSIFPESKGFGLQYSESRNEFVLVTHEDTISRIGKGEDLCVMLRQCKTQLVNNREFELAAEVRDLMEKIRRMKI